MEVITSLEEIVGLSFPVRKGVRLLGTRVYIDMDLSFMYNGEPIQLYNPRAGLMVPSESVKDEVFIQEAYFAYAQTTTGFSTIDAFYKSMEAKGLFEKSLDNYEYDIDADNPLQPYLFVVINIDGKEHTLSSRQWNAIPPVALQRESDEPAYCMDIDNAKALVSNRIIFNTGIVPTVRLVVYFPDGYDGEHFNFATATEQVTSHIMSANVPEPDAHAFLNAVYVSGGRLVKARSERQ